MTVAIAESHLKERPHDKNITLNALLSTAYKWTESEEGKKQMKVFEIGNIHYDGKMSVEAVENFKGSNWIAKNQEAYHKQLKQVWISLIGSYPQVYGTKDYIKACDQLGIRY